MNYRRYSLLIAVLAAGCGGPSLSDPNNVNQADPTTVRGTVEGTVRGVSGNALSGATVAVQASTSDVLSATTDANGRFKIANVPAESDFSMTISNTGYLTVELRDQTIAATVGDEPMTDGAADKNIILIRSGQAFGTEITGGVSTYPLPETGLLNVKACFQLPVTILPATSINLPPSVIMFPYCIAGTYTRTTVVTRGLVDFAAGPSFADLAYVVTMTEVNLEPVIWIEDTTGKFLPKATATGDTTLAKLMTMDSDGWSATIDLINTNPI